MFDFDALDRFERGLQEAEAMSPRDKSGVGDAATVARADYLQDLSHSLYKRSQSARIEGLHG